MTKLYRHYSLTLFALVLFSLMLGFFTAGCIEKEASPDNEIQAAPRTVQKAADEAKELNDRATQAQSMDSNTGK